MYIAYQDKVISHTFISCTCVCLLVSYLNMPSASVILSPVSKKREEEEEIKKSLQSVHMDTDVGQVGRKSSLKNPGQDGSSKMARVAPYDYATTPVTPIASVASAFSDSRRL